MQTQQKDSKKLTDYWKTIVSKIKCMLLQIHFQLQRAWKNIKANPSLYGLYIGIAALVGMFILFAVNSYRTGQIEEANKRRWQGLNQEVQDVKKGVNSLPHRMQQLNRKSIATIKREKFTPPLKIFSEEPYGEFGCFDYVVFKVAKETEKEILFSNEESNPVVSFSFTYNKETGEVNNKPEAIRFNEKNPKASYKNYLGYLLFIKAEFSNARLVFWDLFEDKPFIRTGPTMPVNLRYDYKGSKAAITFVSKMIRIEHFLGKQIPFKLPPTESVFEDVNYVCDALSGKPIQAGFKYERELKNLKEKKWFLKHFWKLGLNGVEYRMEGKSNIIEIYGVPIELGMWTIDFPDSTVTPSIEDLKKDKSDDPVTITIATKTRDKEIVLIYNTHRKEYRLTDPPLPLLPKDPLMSQ